MVDNIRGKFSGNRIVFILLFVGSTLLASTSSSQSAENTSSGSGTLTYPVLQPLAGLSDPSLAFGVDGTADWMVSMPFLNIAKQGRYWLGHLPGQWGGVSYEDLMAGGHLDQNGYPIQIPDEINYIEMVYAWEENYYGSEQERAGRYIFTYDGEGEINVVARTISKKSGRIVFDVRPGDFISVQIYSTDPNGTGNHLRNFEIVREDRLPLYETGAIFNPNFIDSIKDARHLRFMGAMKVNNSPITTWDEYPTEAHFAWREMPLSVMVKLANEIGADPWFTMPFNADDDFNRRFAEYVRDNLDPDLVARVELSNEVWNFLFVQAHESAEAARDRYGTDDDAAWMQYFGERTAKVMSIWTKVFGDETDTRLKRVLGAFTDNAWMTERSLLAEHWQRIDPSGYYPPHTVIDEVAVVTYFGVLSIVEPETRAALVAAIKDPDIDDFDWHRDRLIPNIKEELTEVLVAQQNVVDPYGIKLVVYEGGQHVHHAAGLEGIPQEELEALQDHLINFIRSPQMAELYDHSWNEWRKFDGGPYMQFSAVGLPGFYGSWSMLASYVDSTPRATYLTNKNKSTPAWWESRGGDHFRHGLLELGTDANDTIAGTTAEDYLIGDGGNDLIYPGPGNDGINGGDGADTVMFSGHRSTYSVHPEGKGFRVNGPDGSDYIYAVEFIYFEDGTRIDLNTVTPSGSGQTATEIELNQ